MIVPITHEQEWRAILDGLPRFLPTDKPLVVVSPHPDDETLGAGGLIAAHSRAGGDVLVIAVTDGENAYEENEGLAALRIREQEAAVQTLSKGKARLVRFALTDSRVSDQMQELVGLLADHIEPESHVVAPWIGDFHPDHEACGWAALEAARKVSAQLSWYFFWTWHRGQPDALSALNVQSFPLDDELLARKLHALQCHRSQLERAGGDPILPENLLAPARRKFEVFAAA